MIVNGCIVAVNYYPGAGGNFVQNCMALSKHCILRDKDYAEWQLDARVDTEFYQQKLAWVLDTVPTGIIDNSWVSYELGSHRLIGFRLSAEHTDRAIPEVVHRAAEQGLWLTYGTHSHQQTSNFTRLWPEVRYINVLGKNWAKRWQKIKKHRSVFGPGDVLTIPKNYSDWEPSPNAYAIDFDSLIESESNFLQTMRHVYSWLEWDDFDQAPVAEYYRAYKQAHDRQPAIE